MLTQVLSSSIWQTVGVFLAIGGAVAAIIFFLRSQRPAKEKTIIGSAIIILTALVIVVSGLGVATFSPSPGPNPARGTSTTADSQSLTATSAHTSSSPSPTPSPTTTSTPLSNNYAATDPGPRCDTGGGTWDPEGFVPPLTCDTRLSVSENNRGYLQFHLPNNEAFSPNNRISVTGDFISGVGKSCVGLAEENASKGYLVEFCNDGGWFIYSISSAGATTGMLKQGITTSPGGAFSQDIALTLQGTTLSFSIGASETHSITISSIQPSKVAITFYCNGYSPSESIQVNNFSYTSQ